MEFKLGQFLPEVDTRKCVDCGLCIDVCPGIDLNPIDAPLEDDVLNWMIGKSLGCFTGHASNPLYRSNGSSGGIITTFLIDLIGSKDFDAAFVLDFDTFTKEPARLKVAQSIEELLGAAKSKYVPSSLYNVAKALMKKDNKRYVVIGTSCQIRGLKRLIKKCNIPEEKVLLLGLFCDKTLNFNFIRYFENKYAKNGKITKIEFRSKEKSGWPGDFKLLFHSGKKLTLGRGERIKLKDFFQLNRCLLCFDKLNCSADISFGDCYIRDKESRWGNSNVIVRTGKGLMYLQKHSNSLCLEKESMARIVESQLLSKKRENFEFNNVFRAKYGLGGESHHAGQRYDKKLSNLQYCGYLGANCNFNRIDISLVILDLKIKLKYAIKTLEQINALSKMFLFAFSNKPGQKSVGKNIILLGANFGNKGSEAMAFTVIDEVKRKFADKNVYLFSTEDYRRNKNIYSFEILPWDPINFLSSNIPSIFKNESEFGAIRNKIDEIIKDTALVIDISGYALSSQWGSISSLRYLANIAIAKKYSIPYYIYPQSMGPFNYRYGKLTIKFLLKAYLKYPAKIFIREKNGLDVLCKLTPKNVERRNDIVLTARSIKLSNIFREEIVLKQIAVGANAVAVIPNIRLFERRSQQQLLQMYKRFIDKLVESNKTVYIFRHSIEDLPVCEHVKELFLDNVAVVLVDSDLSSLDFQGNIHRFNFIITSRYHSVIHAYKRGVPAVVIGWAEKYSELLDTFDQAEYLINVDRLVVDQTMTILENMLNNYSLESKRIMANLNDVYSKNEASIL